MKTYYYSLPASLLVKHKNMRIPYVYDSFKLDETIASALKEFQLSYNPGWHCLVISSHEDESNLALFKLAYL